MFEVAWNFPLPMLYTAVGLGFPVVCPQMPFYCHVVTTQEGSWAIRNSTYCRELWI